MSSLYIHIPFCLRKCVYCDFYVEPLGTGPLPRRFAELDHSDHADFVQAMEQELKALPQDFTPSAIYIGGGTPTELSLRDFETLLRVIHEHVALRDGIEWTVESNPGTLTREKVRLMLDAGVNRISLGVQSFQAASLEFLTRIHSAEDAVATYDMVRKEGANNVNIDLLFGVPGTTLEDTRADMRRLAELQPEHVSWYYLDFDEESGLKIMRDKGLVKELDDEIGVTQYRHIREGLAKAEYEHYEVFNYCLPGKACRYNQDCWQSEDYIGIGPSAHSHWQGRRYGNVANLGKYIQCLSERQPARDMEETLNPEAKARESLIVGLRQRAGVDRQWFQNKTGYDYMDLCGDEIKTLIQEGLLEEINQQLRLPDEALLISNGVYRRLL